LRTERDALARKNEDLESQLDKKRHSLDPRDPAFSNMHGMVSVWMNYRRAIGYETRPCMILFSATPDTSEISGTVMQLAVLGANCANGNLLNIGVKPEDLEKEEVKGIIPGVIVVHAPPRARGVDQLVDNLGNFIQTKRSYSMPVASPQGPRVQNVIWLQFGVGTGWNTQLQ
jgi:hypothetical protein